MILILAKIVMIIILAKVVQPCYTYNNNSYWRGLKQIHVSINTTTRMHENNNLCSGPLSVLMWSFCWLFSFECEWSFTAWEIVAISAANHGDSSRFVAHDFLVQHKRRTWLWLWLDRIDVRHGFGSSHVTWPRHCSCVLVKKKKNEQMYFIYIYMLFYASVLLNCSISAKLPTRVPRTTQEAA